MIFNNHGKKLYCFAFIIVISSLSLFIGIDSSIKTHIETGSFEKLQTSATIMHTNVLWVENPTFEDPIEPTWYPSIQGDVSDVYASTSLNQANMIIVGESHEKQIILNSTTQSDWIPFNKSGQVLVPNLGYGVDEDGCYCGHDWNETLGPNNTPSMHWKADVSIPNDMSNYIITSVSFEAIINATVNRNVDTPGDTIAKWNPISPLDQFEKYDYIQFYIEITTLAMDEINTYRISFNQTRMLGNDNVTNYNMERVIGFQNEQEIINALNRVLAVDFGHDNFTVVLGIKIYSEDNFSGMDSDQWDDVRFKFLNFTFLYEKTIDQFTSGSWAQDLDEISGTNIQITDANLNFKYKIDQNWTDSSQNSQIKIYLNDRKFEQTISLIDFDDSSGFQEARSGGFDIGEILLPYENFTLSIQVFLAENFELNSNITISITDVYLYVSYTETTIYAVAEPWLSTGLIIILIVVAIVSMVSTVMTRQKYKRGTQQSLLEKLSFTAGYPNIIRSDNWYSLFLYLHLPKFQKNVRKILEEKSHQQGFSPAVSATDSFNLIERGTRLKIIPNVKGITFNPTEQELAWYEDIQEVIFRLKADSNMMDRLLIGSIDIYKGYLLIGHIPISIKVSMTKKTVEMVMANSKIFEKLFASYSHKDASIVNQFILAYKALGIKVYIDKETLRSGEKWRKKLTQLIERADVFQLYWSEAASESFNVQKEWEYALILLSQKGEKFIRPCYWEIPMPDPPIKLESFHFEALDIEKIKKLGLNPRLAKR